MKYPPDLARLDCQTLLAWRPAPAAALTLVLGIAALSGWGAFASRASAQRDVAEQVSLLQADRKNLSGRQRQLEQANAELLRDWQGKLASVRKELSQANAARDTPRGQLASSQRELATLKKRLDQARDRVPETGSIKPANSTKKAAR